MMRSSQRQRKYYYASLSPTIAPHPELRIPVASLYNSTIDSKPGIGIMGLLLAESMQLRLIQKV